MAIVNTFSELIKKQVDLFQNNNVAWMSTMATSWAIQEIMGMGYGKLLRSGKIKPVYEIEDQDSLWKSVDEFSNGQKDEMIRHRIAKCLITLEYFLQ